MKLGSLCALGGFTPYPVLSAIRHWPEDFLPRLMEAAVGVSDAAKVKGPASYFRRSKRPTGNRSLIEAQIATQVGKTHMQVVAWLKEAYGLGHGHANALVAYFMSKSTEKKSK